MRKVDRRLLLCVFLVALGVTGSVSAQNESPAKPEASVAAAVSQSAPVTPEQQQLLKATEAFVRDLYAWGSDYKLTLGPLTQSSAAEFYKVPIQVTFNGQSDNGEVYVSKDGRTVLRGDVFSLHGDPYEQVREHLNIAGNPSTGPENAPVTLVEFADFECPHCREFSQNFEAIRQKFPQVRLVYKDFPLVDLHPWAETAAVAARCAYMQSPAAFWKMHDAIFKNQDNITPDNVYDELNNLAKDQGLGADAFKSCLSSPEAAKAVEANRADGITLGISSTPTVYVNGRPVVGGDPATVEQFIQYELNTHAK
ncbi:MAG TPA: DsbA family protein [Candidatus Acidoferrales bacterium]